MGQLEYLGICSDVAVFGRLCCYGFLVKIQWVSLNAWELICSQVAMFGHLCCMRAVISSGGGDEDETSNARVAITFGRGEGNGKKRETPQLFGW